VSLESYKARRPISFSDIVVLFSFDLKLGLFVQRATAFI